HGFTARLIPAPRADTIARLGLAKILSADTVQPEALDANYIRRSDAELFSLPKLSSSCPASDSPPPPMSLPSWNWIALPPPRTGVLPITSASSAPTRRPAWL